MLPRPRQYVPLGCAYRELALSTSSFRRASSNAKNPEAVDEQEAPPSAPIPKPSLIDDIRDIILPRPLPNPPEYEEERRRAELERQRAGDTHRSMFARLQHGVRLYADTWRSKKAASESSGDTHGDGDDARIKELLNEVRLNSISMQDVAKHQYAVRARALQLAVKEFVIGWHETRRGDSNSGRRDPPSR